MPRARIALQPVEDRPSVEDRQLEIEGDGVGKNLVGQGEPGHSAFVVCEGRVRVSLDPGDVELAVLERGACFGEMSLLTGDPRTASVRALGDCTVVEITSDAFRAFVLNQPARVERIGAVIAERRAGIARARATVANVPPPESASSLVARVRRFFGL